MTKLNKFDLTEYYEDEQSILRLKSQLESALSYLAYDSKNRGSDLSDFDDLIDLNLYLTNFLLKNK